jgi:hypothetical protein
VKVLILSNSEWDDGNSFGSSFSNIFGNNEKLELANIYCRSGKPNTRSCTHFFQISEKLLLRNLLNFQNPPGLIIEQSSSANHAPDIIAAKQLLLINFMRMRRWIVFFWLREIIWFFGRWKSVELKKFITEFEPDLIFLPIYYSGYLNKIGIFLKYFSNKPMVGYISDDCYTLRQFSLSPLYWIDRLIKRIWVKKAIDECQILFVISDIQKHDYDKIFRKDCKILFKGGVFSGPAPVNTTLNKPLQLIYTGNIGTGRYKTLAKIGDALDKINNNGIKAILNIFSQTPMSNNMKSELLSKKSIIFHGSVSQNLIKEIQSKGDILVHAESFRLKDRLEVRHSFSTKIVDYFQIARCVFAVGWKESASIKYLIKNDAALVATNNTEIEINLNRLIDHPEVISDYALKAWNCGKSNHQIHLIQSSLVNDLISLK